MRLSALGLVDPPRGHRAQRHRDVFHEVASKPASPAAARTLLWELGRAIRLLCVAGGAELASRTVEGTIYY